MLNQYISTGYYVSDCENGLQPPITGVAIFTGFLDQCDADGQSYYLAIQNAAYLRSLNPCLSPATTTTTTTTTVTTLPPTTYNYNNTIIYDWTGDFNGENEEYYDIVSWGNTNGYLSGNKYQTNQYFSWISSNDTSIMEGVVLAVIKGSGLVTGFGNNACRLLDIPTGLSGVIQISVGYDHCVALKNDGTVTGWGSDYWGALNINSSLSNVKKACAGIGSSVFLLDGGIVTGTSTIGGGYPISYPTGSGYLNIDHYQIHVLMMDSNGFLTGIGLNNFGECDTRNINGINKICAGSSTSMFTYSGYVSGYGTQQALLNTPNVSNSGIDIQLRGHIGTILQNNQDILQWVEPWNEELEYISKPNDLENNVVAISQGTRFTAAIFKRPHVLSTQSITGYQYIWKVVYVGGVESYGGISLNDYFPPNGNLVQSCDNASYVLPNISGINQSFTGTFNNCNAYAGTHAVVLDSVLYQYPMININYIGSTGLHKTGFAATGITTNDYWNPMRVTNRSYSGLYYSDGSQSYVSGGFIRAGTGTGVYFTHNDVMYGSAISGSGTLLIDFSRLPVGNYKFFIYSHGVSSGEYGQIMFSSNGIITDIKTTSSGTNYNSSEWQTGVQYVSIDTPIYSTGQKIQIFANKHINGIQIINVSNSR